MTLASAAMAGGAASRFVRSGTTLEPFQPDRASTLVTSGPNAITRNPMYAGLTGLLLAHALWRGSWKAVLPVAGFVAFIDRAQIRPEEEALLEKFGPAYDAYRATTPRWVDHRSFGLRQGRNPSQPSARLGKQ
ncbi:methyltransferase family protein [Knoellia sp. CPCC 206435]|uniref:methyltransferase family protein n=1 Tax=Knoellia terrae TaxID=3404797 RepID=UPI003B433A1A